MRRRTYLGALGTVAGATAGCLGFRAPTDRPDRSCRTFVAESSESVCAGTDGRDSASLPLVPEGETFAVSTGDDAVETFTFTLRNRSRRRFVARERLLVRDPEGDVARVVDDDERVGVPPGASHDWSLSLSPHPAPGNSNASPVVPHADLPDGAYAFVVAGVLGADDPTRIETHARFAIERT